MAQQKPTVCVGESDGWLSKERGFEDSWRDEPNGRVSAGRILPPDVVNGRRPIARVLQRSGTPKLYSGVEMIIASASAILC